VIRRYVLYSEAEDIMHCTSVLGRLAIEGTSIDYRIALRRPVVRHETRSVIWSFSLAEPSCIEGGTVVSANKIWSGCER
jgi:hypothetical protein